MTRRARIIGWVVVVLALSTSAILPTYYASLVSYAIVLALLGIAINIAVGYLGLISFGHAAFFGLGAYSAGLLAVKAGVSFWLAALAAIVPGVLLGVLVGFASLRVRGPYFAIATLVVAEIMRLIAQSWTSLTRGPLGLIVPRPRIEFFESHGFGYMQYYLAICILALALVLELLRRLLSSPYGRAWFALRDQQGLAESVGIPPLKYRVAAISLSGGISALAGALLVPRILVLSPDLFSVSFSATGLLVTILGGKGTLLGPLFGGLVFSVAPELLRAIDEYRIAVFAALLLIMVRIWPEGLALLLPRAKRAVDVEAKILPTRHVGATSDQLVVKNLFKQYGGLRAVDDLTFSMRPGSILGLIGPNGAGKTTCLSLVSGFISPTTGTISLDGQQLSGLSPSKIAALGVVRTFQHTTLCPALSAFDNVLIGTHLIMKESPLHIILNSKMFKQRETTRRAWARACIDTVGLGDRCNVYAGDLAYGEQRMLSIAIALAAQPRFLLLDEPGAGLNGAEAVALASLLRRLRDQNLAISIIDHNVRMMMGICDELIVLHHGKLLAAGKPAVVRNDANVIRAYLGEKKAPTTSEESVHAQA